MNQPTTTLPAMIGPYPMVSLERALPETFERRCPSCQGQSIVHAGHVVAGAGMIRSEHRCEECSTAFWFVRKRIDGAAFGAVPTA